MDTQLVGPYTITKKCWKRSLCPPVTENPSAVIEQVNGALLNLTNPLPEPYN